jgi:hypothetical protein
MAPIGNADSNVRTGFMPAFLLVVLFLGSVALWGFRW